jgi:uncharacterized protein (DUF1778 family)
MKLITHTQAIDLSVGQTRSAGRTGRDRMANARVTEAERQELHAAARLKGMSLSEWAREVLLREARRSDEDPLFIELIATRMLLVNLLKPLAMGKIVTQEDYTRISAAVRSDKRKVANEIQQQYTAPAAKE